MSPIIIKVQKHYLLKSLGKLMGDTPVSAQSFFHSMLTLRLNNSSLPFTLLLLNFYDLMYTSS